MDATSEIGDAPQGPPPPAKPDGAPTGPAALLLGLSFVTGSVALLLAMATDFAAVVCRHLHLSFIGAIEIIQACVVLAISAGVVAATLTGAHAAVHLVTERLPAPWRAGFGRVSAALGFVCFLAFAVGEAWLFYDTRNWDERSDLLGIPIWPLRAIWATSLFVVAVLFLLRAIRGARAETRPEVRP
jgi:TRAP-type C4-dicarboxylate transport system permease small subunit